MELGALDLSTPEEIGKVIDQFGYHSEWRRDYKIQSVRSSLHSQNITCMDSAVFSYGLLELLFPQVKRRLLAIHRRDMYGEECGHCVTLYWGNDGKIGAFSKSSFPGFDHRPPVFGEEADVANSFAEAYLKMGFTPLYFGVTTLEQITEGLDWRFGKGHLNEISERIKDYYEYGFSVV